MGVKQGSVFIGDVRKINMTIQKKGTKSGTEALKQPLPTSVLKITQVNNINKQNNDDKSLNKSLLTSSQFELLSVVPMASARRQEVEVII